MDDVVVAHAVPKLWADTTKMRLLFVIHAELVGYPSSKQCCCCVHIESKRSSRAVPAKLFAYQGIGNKVATEAPTFFRGAKTKEAFVCQVFPVLGWECGVSVVLASSF
jgi:hypothetical protein